MFTLKTVLGRRFESRHKLQAGSPRWQFRASLFSGALILYPRSRAMSLSFIVRSTYCFFIADVI